MSTFQELLTEGRCLLQEHGVPEPSIDARYLLEYATGMSREKLLFHQWDIASARQEALYKKFLAQRARRIPLQQITGTAWFMGLAFYVNAHVLIPRMDTEVLVDEVQKVLYGGMKVLDLCTGSGCILLSLLANIKGIIGTGVDLSSEALEVAKINEERLTDQGLLPSDSLTWIQSDLFEGVSGRYQVITANPPYIPTTVISDLMPEVGAYEPKMALDGGEDGLNFYRRIIRGAKDYLEPGGWLFFEISQDQGEQVCALLVKEQYQEIKIKKDLAGLDRMVCGRRQR